VSPRKLAPPTQHNHRRSVECIPTSFKIENRYLVRVTVRWHFLARSVGELMSKRENGCDPKKDRPMPGEAAPPLLSDKLIAQLQNAVSAAQRKRMSDRNDSTAGSPDKES
jgi:hypothetical protein